MRSSILKDGHLVLVQNDFRMMATKTDEGLNWLLLKKKKTITVLVLMFLGSYIHSWPTIIWFLPAMLFEQDVNGELPQIQFYMFSRFDQDSDMHRLHIGQVGLSRSLLSESVTEKMTTPVISPH